MRKYGHSDFVDGTITTKTKAAATTKIATKKKLIKFLVQSEHLANKTYI